MAEHLQEITQIDQIADKAARIISCLSALQSGGSVMLHIPRAQIDAAPFTYTFPSKTEPKNTNQ